MDLFKTISDLNVFTVLCACHPFSILEVPLLWQERLQWIARGFTPTFMIRVTCIHCGSYEAEIVNELDEYDEEVGMWGSLFEKICFKNRLPRFRVRLQNGILRKVG